MDDVGEATREGTGDATGEGAGVATGDATGEPSSTQSFGMEKLLLVESLTSEFAKDPE